MDRTKTSPSNLFVEGGSIITPQVLVTSVCVLHFTWPFSLITDQTFSPKHHEVAKTIGAAIASMSGEVDRHYRDTPKLVPL